MVELVPAHRSCPVFLLPGRSGFVPLTKSSFVSLFRKCLRKPVFRIHIIFVVTLFGVARPRGLSSAVYRGNLYSYTVIGPVILINFTWTLFQTLS